MNAVPCAPWHPAPRTARRAGEPLAPQPMLVPRRFSGAARRRVDAGSGLPASPVVLASVTHVRVAESLLRKAEIFSDVHAGRRLRFQKWSCSGTGRSAGIQSQPVAHARADPLRLRPGTALGLYPLLPVPQ